MSSGVGEIHSCFRHTETVDMCCRCPYHCVNIEAGRPHGQGMYSVSRAYGESPNCRHLAQKWMRSQAREEGQMYVTICKSANKEMAKEAETIWLKYCQWARAMWRTPNQAEESQLCHSAEILSVKITVGFQTTLKMMGMFPGEACGWKWVPPLLYFRDLLLLWF